MAKERPGCREGLAKERPAVIEKDWLKRRLGCKERFVEEKASSCKLGLSEEKDCL